MIQEDKELLLKDICARLPYQPLCKKVDTEDDFCECDAPLGYSLRDLVDNKIIIKPYLRPMSSMTEEEKKELGNFVAAVMFASQNKNPLFQLTRETLLGDFFNKHHIDYRGLIEKGLAIEVKEENNPYKT